MYNRDLGQSIIVKLEVLNLRCLERPVRDSIDRLDDIMKTVLHLGVEDARGRFCSSSEKFGKALQLLKLGHGGILWGDGARVLLGRLKMMSGEGG